MTPKLRNLFICFGVSFRAMLFCMTPKLENFKRYQIPSFRAMLFCMTPKQLTLFDNSERGFRAMLFSALILQKGSRRFLCDHKKYGGLKIFG